MGVYFISVVLLLSCFVVSGNLNNTNDHVVLVAPVLAPPRNNRARVTETAKDFPFLMLLATGYKTKVKMEKNTNEVEPQPIYVEVSKIVNTFNVSNSKYLFFYVK